MNARVYGKRVYGVQEDRTLFFHPGLAGAAVDTRISSPAA